MVKDLDNIFAKVMKQNADEVTAQEENSRHVPLMTRICQSRLASFYNIPAVSALLRLFVSVIRVVVMAAVLMSFERVYGSEAMSGLGDESSPALAWEGDGSEFATPLPLNRWEVAWMVFGLGTLIDKAQQHFRMVRAKLTYLSGNNFWSMLGRTQQMLFVFNAALRLVICFATMGHDVASRLYSAYEIIFSVATAVTTLMILPQVTMFSEGFLLLVLIFENLLYDLVRWVALLSFFIVAFVLCFTGLYNAGWMTTPSAQFANNNGPLAAPLWALFGSWNYDNFGEAMPLYTPAPMLPLHTVSLLCSPRRTWASGPCRWWGPLRRRSGVVGLPASTLSLCEHALASASTAYKLVAACETLFALDGISRRRVFCAARDLRKTHIQE